MQITEIFDKISALFFGLPERIRMMITALIGVSIGFVTYELIYWLNPLPLYKASSSWLVSFLIAVPRQHGLHRLLTFRHRSPYWKSLGRAYMMYSLSTGLSVSLNFYLTQIAGVHHRLAWLACLTVTALISLLFLKRLVFFRQSDSFTGSVRSPAFTSLYADQER